MIEPMNKAIYVASVGSMIAALLLAACGSSSTAAPLTKAQFIQEANAICRNAEAERDQAGRDAADNSPEAPELVAEVLAPVQTMTEELGELGPPKGEKKEVQAIIGAFEAGIEKIEANPADVTAAMAAFDKANGLAQNYGLTDCTI